MPKHQSLLNAALNEGQANAILGNMPKRQSIALNADHASQEGAVIVEESAVITANSLASRGVKPQFIASGPAATEIGDSVRVYNAGLVTALVYPPRATGHRLGQQTTDGATIAVQPGQLAELTYMGELEVAAGVTKHRWAAIIHNAT